MSGQADKDYAKSAAATTQNVSVLSWRDRLHVVTLCQCERRDELHQEGPLCEGPWVYAIIVGVYTVDKPRIAFASRSLAVAGLATLREYDDALVGRIFSRKPRRGFI